MELSKAQNQVITIHGKNMLISASAGSGKTFVLVERVVDQVVNKKIDIDKFLIITFTRAAASELKERIYSKLVEKQQEAQESDNHELAKYILRQITKVGQANISTIHSFCMQVITSSFYVLGIDPMVSTITKTKADILLLESIEEVVTEEYEKANEYFFDLLDLFQGEENLKGELRQMYQKCRSVTSFAKFKDTALQMYNNEKCDLSQTTFGKALMKNIKEKVELVLLNLDGVISKLIGIDEFESRLNVLKFVENIYINLKLCKKYDEMCETILLIKQVPRMPSTKTLDEELKEEVKLAKSKAVDDLKDIAKLLQKDSNKCIDELNNMYSTVSYLFYLIEQIENIYILKKNKINAIDFGDYEHMTLQALKNENIRKNLQEKYYEIYVDEYQDTSYLQEAIISQIVKTNNCVMVGDVKQSIYGFRGAVPQIIISKYETFSDVNENLEDINVRIMLDTNYRSRKQVIDSVNLVFEKLMRLDFGGAEYNEMESLKYGNVYEREEKIDESMYKTRLNIMEYNKDEKVDDGQEETTDEVQAMTNMQMEAKGIACRIKELCTNFNVWDKALNNYRKCEYKDIVILLQVQQNRSNVLLDEFKKHNIPAVDSSSTNFFETNEIMVVTSFLKVIDNVYDDISLASIMYSIIGKFNMDELVRIRQYNSKGYFIDNINEYLEKEADVEQEQVTINKLQSLLDILKKYRTYTQTYSLSECLIKLYNETYVYESIPIDEYTAQKKANLDSFLNIAKDYEKEDTKSIYSFIQYIENIKQSKSYADSPKVLGENENVIRIMTIHHSKGLEFPIVIIANTTEKIKVNIKDKVVVKPGLGVGINILNEVCKAKISYPSIITLWLKQVMAKEFLEEGLRLLYVAMTRAKEHLEIFGTVKDFEKYKEKFNLNINDRKIPQAVVQTCTCNLDYIMQGVLSSKNTKEIFEISVIQENQVNEKTEEKKKTVLSVTEKINSLKEQFDVQVKQDIQSKLNQQYITNYKYSSAINLEEKYSVSDIKQKENEQKKYELMALDKITPKILNTSTPADFGTIVHKVLEHDNIHQMSDSEILEYISLLGSEFDVQKILYMVREILNTKVGEMLIKAKKVEHEFEFVLLDDLENILPKKYFEPVMIQGAIDLLLDLGAGSYVIIDYKTDKVNSEEELIDRYKIQLDIYKRGVEKALQTNDCETYIYSFALKKLIKL